MSDGGLHGRQRQSMDMVEGMHDQEIAVGESRQERRRLAREARAARGGTPLQRAWRRLTGRSTPETRD